MESLFTKYPVHKEDSSSETNNLGPYYPNSKPEEKPKRTLPSDSNVYHFHPIAFMEQIKRINDKRASQIKITLEEAK